VSDAQGGMILRSLVGIADGSFMFARHSEAARTQMTSMSNTTGAAAVQHAQASRSAASVVTALVELRWLLTAEVIYMLDSSYADRYSSTARQRSLAYVCKSLRAVQFFLLLQLPGDMLLAVAGATAASLSYHLDGYMKRTSDGVDRTAASQLAVLAADDTEAEGLTVQLSAEEEGDGSSVQLGTEHWLPVQQAVTRMLRSAGAGSSDAADATANLQALTLLAQLPIRGALCRDCSVSNRSVQSPVA